MRNRGAWALVIAALIFAPAQAAPPATASTTIAMADGVKLAADVVTPAAAAGARFPVVVLMTRYGRATRLSDRAVQALTAAGLALVFVDMRGSGASQGHVTAVFSREERGDIGPVLDWIAKQPWSDGRIIATGASYDGNLAALALAAGNPALVAAAPRFIDFDTYRDLVVPGGVRDDMFLRAWGTLTEELDGGKACLADAHACPALAHLKPVDGDGDRRQLRAALLDHQRNWHAYDDMRGYSFEDDVTPSGRDLREGFLSSQVPALKAAKAPVQLWGSWFDASTADSALDWWAAAPKAPLELYLGAWTHGGGARVDPLVRDSANDEPGAPSTAIQFLDFARRALAGQPVARRIHYYTAGAAVWRTTAQWPPANISPARWYLSAGAALDRQAPSAGEGADRYAVDFSATTGKTTRWTTQLGGGSVDYGDRAGPDRKLLTYTSAPLERDIEVTGAAAVTLHLASTRADGAVFAYLETVAPDGRGLYLSEGELRLPLRGARGADPSFLKADMAPLSPGQVIEASLRLHAVSAVVPKGYRLRIAIAGADADAFARYPQKGEATYTICRSAALASYIDLPQADWPGAARP
jgi:putative CocE/NonD family hydrolase